MLDLSAFSHESIFQFVAVSSVAAATRSCNTLFLVSSAPIEAAGFHVETNRSRELLKLGALPPLLAKILRGRFSL